MDAPCRKRKDVRDKGQPSQRREGGIGRQQIDNYGPCNGRGTVSCVWKVCGYSTVVTIDSSEKTSFRSRKLLWICLLDFALSRLQNGDWLHRFLLPFHNSLSFLRLRWRQAFRTVSFSDLSLALAPRSLRRVYLTRTISPERVSTQQYLLRPGEDLRSLAVTYAQEDFAGGVQIRAALMPDVKPA